MVNEPNDEKLEISYHFSYSELSSNADAKSYPISR